jgi:hypothetical protein
MKVFFAHAKVAGRLTLKPNLAPLAMEMAASYINPRPYDSQTAKEISYQLSALGYLLWRVC